MQKPEPILVADRFPALLDSLLDLLDSLSADEWAVPTAAAGWSVKDVALHLLGDEISILSGKRDSFSEPQAGLDVWENLVAFINRRNAEWVQAARRISPRLLCELLRFTGEQSNALFASLDPLALGGAVSWAGSAPAPVWLDIAREFTERWHHQQHIRDAVGKPGCTESYFLAPVLAAFVYALPRTYHHVSAAPGTAISLKITGESGGVWTVLREEAGWQLYLGEAGQPQAGIVLPEDTAWRLFTKGISAADARASAVLHGDLALAEKALETIAIIG
jgi:uncharacterized protein (TIGR03083 family)